MIVSLIWAMDENRVIGINNSLPWKLPADMKWFRQNTMGKPIVMGRKTFESFGARALPDRQNIVITHDRAYQAEGVDVVHSIDEALAVAGDAEEIMIIGGASFYQQMLPTVDRLYITQVHGQFEGDTWFPQFDMGDWKEVQCSESTADEKNAYACTFMIYERSV